VRLTDLSYEDWLEHAFGREVRIQQAAWFFDHDRDWCRKPRCERWRASSTSNRSPVRRALCTGSDIGRKRMIVG
jgi:hypothetical protein